MDLSESTTGQHDSVMPSRGRSSAAEHQLPKLRTRVRFPSPALGNFWSLSLLLVAIPKSQQALKVRDAKRLVLEFQEESPVEEIA